MARRHRRRRRGRGRFGGIENTLFLMIAGSAMIFGLVEYLQNRSLLLPIAALVMGSIVILAAKGVWDFYFHVQKIRLREMKFKRYVNADLTRLRELTDREFEFFVSRIYFAHGYEVKVTPQSNDQGIDIWAWKDGVKYGIQVKQYGPNHSVVPKEMRELFGSYSFEPGVKGIFVTASDFSLETKLWAMERGIELVDGKRLLEMNTKWRELPWYRYFWRTPRYDEIDAPRIRVPIEKSKELRSWPHISSQR